MRTSALYLAVLNKSDPSPLLPESDEETGVAAPATGGGRGGRGGSAARGRRCGQHGRAPAGRRRRDARPVNVTIDFDGLSGRIVAVPGIAAAPVRQGQGRRRRHGVLHRDPAGRGHAAETAAAAPCTAISCATARRCRSTGVADYDVSADGRKLLYRGRRGRRRRRRPRRRARRRARRCSSSTPIARCRRREPDASRRRCARTSIRRPSSGRSSTKRGATSATTSTCRTRTAPTGRG